MYSALRDASKIIKGSHKACIDSLLFRLHCHVTVAFLVCSVCLLGLSQYFGNPIECNVDGVDNKMMDIYCWIHGTKTDYRLAKMDMVASGRLPHPGVGPRTSSEGHPSSAGGGQQHYGAGIRSSRPEAKFMNRPSTVGHWTGDGGAVVHPLMRHRDADRLTGQDSLLIHSYYQWVPLVLVLSAFSFYLPRLLWKAHEGGRIAHWCEKMRQETYDERVQQRGNSESTAAGKPPPRTWTEVQVEKLLYYLQLYSHKHWRYANMYVLCELLNCLVVILNFVLVNSFLGGRFSVYGFDILTYIRDRVIFMPDESNLESSPTDIVFPKVTSCTFRKYGTSGFVQALHALCVLPLNVVNEKIFVIFWLWLLFLHVANCLNLFSRLVLMYSKKCRRLYWTVAFGLSDDMSQRRRIATCCTAMPYSEWFVLSLVAKNVASHVFAALLRDCPLQSNDGGTYRNLKQRGHIQDFAGRAGLTNSLKMEDRASSHDSALSDSADSIYGVNDRPYKMGSDNLRQAGRLEKGSEPLSRPSGKVGHPPSGRASSDKGSDHSEGDASKDRQQQESAHSVDGKLMTGT